jgi:hypothetical protein
MEVTPKPATTHADEHFRGEFKDQSFEHHHFRDVNARSAVFTDCDFSYCTFERVYFRDATFKNCRLIGARFIDCNFRAATLNLCHLDYASFRGTVLDAREFLANLPPFPNVKVELLRSLRMNAHGLGDVASVNLFVREELAAEREHWRRARHKADTYYAQKYGAPLQRLLVYYRSFVTWLDWFLWGHGEHPWKLVRTLILLLFVFSLIALVNGGALGGSTSISEAGRAWTTAAKTTVAVFVGVPLSPTPQVALWIFCALVVLRLVSVSLFVAILFRRVSRR